MNTYKTILHAVIEPILDTLDGDNWNEQDFLDKVASLKQTSGVDHATGEMLERALRYIRLTLQLIKEKENKP